MNGDNTPQKDNKQSITWTRTVFFIIQILFAVSIIILWFSYKSIPERKELWILFLAVFPSNFISGIIPYDPVVIYFAKYYSPFYIVLLDVSSMLVVETINYSVINFISNAKFIIKIRHSYFIDRMIRLFDKSPFLTLFIVQSLPVPFYPFRILAVLAKYPIAKLLATVFLSKTPRMLFLALIGNLIQIPNYLIFAFFVAIIIVAYISAFINIQKEKRSRGLRRSSRTMQ